MNLYDVEAENDRLQAIIRGLSERAASQSEALARLEAWRSARVGRTFILTAYECMLLDSCTRQKVRALPADLAEHILDGVIVVVGSREQPPTSRDLIRAALDKWAELYGKE